MGGGVGAPVTGATPLPGSWVLDAPVAGSAVGDDPPPAGIGAAGPMGGSGAFETPAAAETAELIALV
jgi:hypothetical protein